MAVTDQLSSGVPFEVSFDAGTTYLVAVCKKAFGLDFTKDVQQEDSDCTTHSSVGRALKFTTNVELILNLTPVVTEASGDDFLGAMQASTLVYFRLRNAAMAATYYRQGTAYISSYAESAPLNGLISATCTMTGTGDVDITA